MESEDFVSNNGFEFKNENRTLIFFNGPSVTFRLWIKEIRLLPAINNCEKYLKNHDCGFKT